MGFAAVITQSRIDHAVIIGDLGTRRAVHRDGGGGAGGVQVVNDKAVGGVRLQTGDIPIVGQGGGPADLLDAALVVGNTGAVRQDGGAVAGEAPGAAHLHIGGGGDGHGDLDGSHIGHGV